MKKRILIFIAFLSTTKLMAQQVGKVDTICPPPPLPPTATLDDLLKRLPQIEVDVNGNVTTKGKPVIRIDCRDVYQPAKNFNCEILERLNEPKPYGRLIYKPDTIQYQLSKYRPAAKAKLSQVLEMLEDFKIDSAGRLCHQGKAVTKFKVNGKTMPVANIGQKLRIMLARNIAMVEVIDDHSLTALRTGGGRSANPDKFLNIILKKGKQLRLEQ